MPTWAGSPLFALGSRHQRRLHAHLAANRRRSKGVRSCRIADDLLRLARRGIGTLQLRADGAASSKRASMRAAENERSKVKVEKSNPSAPSQAKSET
jgi:hypothetical protein